MPHLFPPEGFIKRAPIGFIEFFLWLVLAGGAEENVVPQQIGGKQWFAAGVEGFEDDLGVIALIEIDHHHLQRAFQSLEAFLQTHGYVRLVCQWRLVAAAEEKLGDHVMEIQIGFNHPGPRIVFLGMLAPRERMFLLDCRP